MTAGLIILIAVLACGLYMAWAIGANDVANAMGTSVGSGALTLLSAIVLAGVLEFGGAVLLGANVTETISRGIIDTTMFDIGGQWGERGPLMLAAGMLCALLACAIWLHIATLRGLPVSTTHSIVGAVFGVGLSSFGMAGVEWGMLGMIVFSWVISPVLGGLLAFTSFFAIRRYILSSADPVRATIRTSPYIVGVVAGVIVLSFIYKILDNRFGTPPLILSLGVATGVGVVSGIVTAALTRSLAPSPAMKPYDFVERVFGLIQIGTACFVAFAHGANDVANAIGPVATVVALYQTGFDSIPTGIGVPLWILVLGGGGIVIGLATLGYKVIATVGKEITEITATRGFSAEFGAATTVLLASSIGLPISTTHTLVGAVIGVGFARGIGALNLRVIRNIVSSWVATVPISAVVAAILFYIVRLLIG